MAGLVASPFTHGTNSLPIWRLLRSKCACGMHVCAGLVGTCSHVTKASKTSQEAPGICPFLPPCCRDDRRAPGFSFHRGVKDPNSRPHVYRASASLTEPPSSLQDCLVRGTVGCRKGTQFETTATVPLQGAGQHHVGEHETVGFQLYSPALIHKTGLLWLKMGR